MAQDDTSAGDDERLPVDLEDDELTTDPVDEPDTEEEDTDTDDSAEGTADQQPKTEARATRERGNRQLEALREQNRTNSEENARLTRELNEIRAQISRQQQEDPRAEAERLALMTTEERLNYNLDRGLRRQEAQHQQLTRQLLDQADRNNFTTICSTNRVAAKLAPEVERRLARLRAEGGNADRVVIMKYLLGEQLWSQQGASNSQVKANQRRQQARPVASRGDTMSDRRANRSGDSVEALERRLANVDL